MAVNDEIMNNLAQYGGGSVNERVYNYLGSLGFTGSLSDRLGKYSSEGRNGWQGLTRAFGIWTPAALFVPTWDLTKYAGGGSTDVYAIVSRDSDTQMTLDQDYGVTFYGLVVRDDAAGTHHHYLVESVSGATVTVEGVLPANISECMQVHDSELGQHLSRFGYKALAEFVVDQVQKHTYKQAGSLIFHYHPPVCTREVYSNADIYSYDGSELLISVTKLPNTGAGGSLSNGITRLCQTMPADQGITTFRGQSYLSRAYDITQEIAGTGIEFSFPVGGQDGYIEIPVTAVGADDRYGGGRLEVIGDGSPLLDKTISAGSGVHLEHVDFSGVENITIRLSLTESVPSTLYLHGVYAYQNTNVISTDTLFKEGDVIAFFGDSWTQYPVAEEGETRPTRPDGTTGDGMQFLSEHMRAHLSNQGVNVTTLNMGRGGRTSAWGRYWVDEVVTLTPKPTHCVVLFGINDYNSIDEFESDNPSSYDIDPNDMWSTLLFDQGGIKGSTDTELWFDNLKAICKSLDNAGIKPVVMMPAHVATGSQSQGIQQNQLNKIAAGFSDINEPREQ